MADLGKTFEPTQVPPRQPGDAYPSTDKINPGLPQLSIANAETQFMDFMRSHGLNPPHIKVDAGIQRFHTTGKKGEKNGWYVIDYNGGYSFGFCGCWSQVPTIPWRPNYGYKLNAQEEASLQQKNQRTKKGNRG